MHEIARAWFLLSFIPVPFVQGVGVGLLVPYFIQWPSGDVSFSDTFPGTLQRKRIYPFQFQKLQQISPHHSLTLMVTYPFSNPPLRPGDAKVLIGQDAILDNSEPWVGGWKGEFTLLEVCRRSP